MSNEKALSFDVAVVGAGVAGIMLTKKLSELGFDTALIEKEDKLATGPSTKNEGWLHNGTYHATSINDRSMAMQVARRCMYGHDQIKSFAPESIEDVDLPSYALVRNPEKVDEAISRWDEAGVFYKRMLLKDLVSLEPSVDVSNISAAFQVADLGINTRLLYQKLLTASRNAGATILNGTELKFHGENDAEAVRNGETRELNSKFFIYTAGYGVRSLFLSSFDRSIPLRYWKSHLLVMPRLTKASVFCIDPNEAAMVNHDDFSIVGLNEDAFICEEPDFEPVNTSVKNISDAVGRLFYSFDKSSARSVACVKTDLVERTAEARSLNISISEPMPNHICVLPGKMTETPYVTDVVTKMIYNRSGNTSIALRPMDEMHNI